MTVRKSMEDARLEFDRQKFEAELQIRREELALKRQELDRPGTESGKWKSTPLWIAIVSGFLSLLGAATVNILQSNAAANLERQKFESSLILKAIETGDPDAATRNLLFLLKAKLISDQEGNIAALAADPASAPVLPVSGSGRADVGPPPVPRSAAARAAFFNAYAARFGELKPAARAALSTLIDNFIQEQGPTDVRQVAYLLATVRFETAATFQPLHEFGSDQDMERRYGPGSPIGSRLGNSAIGDGVRYAGRGYLQLVGKNNYAAATKALGLSGPDDLVANPQRMLDPRIAYLVLDWGMRSGRLTGKKLGDYVGGSKADYLSARRVVNGMDHAQTIATEAKTFEDILRQSVAADGVRH